MYLIYETEEEANARADELGKDFNLSYWSNGSGSRWLSSPLITADDKWALPIDGIELSEEDKSRVLEEVVFPIEEVIDILDNTSV